MARKQSRDSVEDIVNHVLASAEPALDIKNQRAVDSILADMGLHSLSRDSEDRKQLDNALEASGLTADEIVDRVLANNGQGTQRPPVGELYGVPEQDLASAVWRNPASEVKSFEQPFERTEEIETEQPSGRRWPAQPRGGKSDDERPLPEAFTGGDKDPDAKEKSEIQKFLSQAGNMQNEEAELQDPKKLLQQQAAFEKFFKDPAAVLPDGEKWNEEAPQKQRRKFGFGRGKKRQAEAGLASAAEEETQQTAPDYGPTPFPEEEVPSQPIEVEGRKYVEAQKGRPTSSVKEISDAWSRVDMPSRTDASYTATWALRETRRGTAQRTHIRTLEFEPKKKKNGAAAGSGTRRKAAAQNNSRRPSAAAEPVVSVAGQTAGTAKAVGAAKAAGTVQTTPPAVAPKPTENPAKGAYTAPDLNVQPGGNAAPQKQRTTPPPVKVAAVEETSEQAMVNLIAQNINQGQYEAAEAAAELTNQKNKPKTGWHLGRKGAAAAEPEEDAAPFTGEDESEEQADDYNKLEDAPAVAADLEVMVLNMRMRSIVTGAVTLLLLYLDIAASGALPLFSPLDPAVTPLGFLGLNLVLLAVAAVVSLPTVQGGFSGIMGNPTPDTIPAMATGTAFLQLLAFLLVPALYDPATEHVFACGAALLLCTNNLGKMLLSLVVRDNFAMVSAGVNHAAAYRLRDKQLTMELTNGLAEKNPSLLISRPTLLVRGFLANSFAQRKSDKNAKQMFWLLSVTAVASALVLLVSHKDVGGALSALAAVFCVGGPLCGTLLGAVPEYMMQRNASRVGAVVPGSNSIRQLGYINAVHTSATDLFPAGCVQLHGIHPFETKRIDLAIVYAASILVEGCNTLQDVFLDILQNNRSMLMPVSNLTTEIGGGFVGWIQHNRVIVGNRKLMEKYDIALPPEKDEKRFTHHGRKPIYLAVSGKLFGMFLVSYVANPNIRSTLQRMNSRGVSLVVTSSDFSIDSNLIESVYGLTAGSVKVLSAKESDDLAPSIAWLTENEGCMVHLGNFASMAGGLQAAAGAEKAEKNATIAMCVSVLISCLATLALAVTGGLAGVTLVGVLLYQLAWCAISLAFPLAQRYT